MWAVGWQVPYWPVTWARCPALRRDPTTTWRAESISTSLNGFGWLGAVSADADGIPVAVGLGFGASGQTPVAVSRR